MAQTHDVTPDCDADAKTVTELAVDNKNPDAGPLLGLKAMVFGSAGHTRKSLKERLKGRGFDVVSTGDAHAARDLFDRDWVDIVLLCSLDGDAIELVKHVRRVQGDRTVIAAHVSTLHETDVRVALHAGLDDTILARDDERELDVTFEIMERRARQRRRRADLERELRESETRYRLLAEHATDMISRHLPDGTFTYVSPACADLLGYEPDELVGQSAYDLIHPDDVSAVRRIHDGVLDHSDVLTVMFRIMGKQGDFVWLETASRAVRSDAGEIESIIAVSRPRNDDSSSAAIAARCRRELRDTQRLARIGSWYWDLETDRATVSDEVYHILDRERDQTHLTPAALLQLVHPQDRLMVEDRIAAVRRGQESLQIYFRVIRPDRQVRTVCGRGELEEDEEGERRFVGTLQDFTELAAAEQALREREAQYRAILETTVDGIITINESGIIESFNRAAERIFGYDAAEVIGTNVSILMPHHYAEEHDNYLRSYIETGHKKIIGIGREVIGRRKNGATFPLELAVSEVQLKDRRIFSGIIRDVSDRRQLEQQILNISEQERQRIGQDLHDGLGQMLTGIGLIMKSVSKRLTDRGLEEVDDVEEVTELIREADEFARSLARGLVPVELDSGGLASAFLRLMVNAEKLFGLDCGFEHVGGEPEVDNTVATHLYRIAQESLSNAVRHGQASQVKVVLATGERHIRLRILDNGRGFPDQLEKNHPGMGIRIMRHRARIIGATLEIRSRPEGGTVVVCTLPRAAALQSNI